MTTKTKRPTKAELTANAEARLRSANEESARDAAAETFAVAYQRHALAVSELKQRETDLKNAQDSLSAVWPTDAQTLATDRGTIARSEKRSFETTAEPEQLVQFAMKHGLSTTAPKPASVAPATIRAAALRGVDVSSVASVTVSHVYTLN